MTPRMLTLAALVFVSLAGVPAAIGQTTLDSGAISANPLSAAQADNVSAFVKERVADLRSGDPERVRRARNDLTQPMLEAQASVSLRQTFAQALTGEKLADLAKDKNEVVAINALRIAGEVATPEMFDIIRAQLGENRSQVRYAAAFAAQRSFQQIAPASRGVAATANDLTDLIGAIGKRLAGEKETLVFDVLARGLVDAVRIDRPRYESVRPAAMSELATALGAKIKDLKPTDTDTIDTLLSVTTQLRDELSRNGAKMPEASRNAAAVLGGQTLAWIGRQASANVYPQIGRNEDKDVQAKKKADRKHVVDLARVAESVVIFAAAGAGQNVPAANLGDALDQATREGDARFLEQFRERIVVGVLTKAPFNASADTFR